MYGGEGEYKYVCITSNHHDTKSKPNLNSNPTTKQHAVVSTDLNLSHMSHHVSRESHMRQNCFTDFTTVRCHCCC